MYFTTLKSACKPNTPLFLSTDLRCARLAAAKRTALREEFSARRPMNRSVNATTAEEAPICRIDDGIYGKRCNIAHEIDHLILRCVRLQDHHSYLFDMHRIAQGTPIFSKPVIYNRSQATIFMVR